eukprot:scpid67543/ scgid18199/ 
MQVDTSTDSTDGQHTSPASLPTSSYPENSPSTTSNQQEKQQDASVTDVAQQHTLPPRVSLLERLQTAFDTATGPKETHNKQQQHQQEDHAAQSDSSKQLHRTSDQPHSQQDGGDTTADTTPGLQSDIVPPFQFSLGSDRAAQASSVPSDAAASPSHIAPSDAAHSTATGRPSKRGPSPAMSETSWILLSEDMNEYHVRNPGQVGMAGESSAQVPGATSTTGLSATETQPTHGSPVTVTASSQAAGSMDTTGRHGASSPHQRSHDTRSHDPDSSDAESQSTTPVAESGVEG